MRTLATPLAVLALTAVRPAPSGATSAIDYVEHIFGATNVNAVAGHGRLTCGIAPDGDLSVLAWPSPGFADQLAYVSSNDIDARALPHLGAADTMGSYLGLLVTTAGGTELTWLRDPAAWTAGQAYSQPDAPVPVTTFANAALGLTVTLTDVITPDVDVLSRGITVTRDAGSPVTAVSLVVYENLSPSLNQIPQAPIGDWALESHNDFLAVWDDQAGAILHFHPGDREVFTSLVELLNLTSDVDFGPVEELMRADPPAAADVDAFVADLDASYTPGVAALVTTEPPPVEHQIGSDPTSMCTLADQLVDNVLALPDTFPGVHVPLTPESVEILRCTDQLPAMADGHAWTWRPQDALADLADGSLSGSPVAAAQTNGALIAPLPPFAGDVTSGAVLLAFGATRAQARAALAAAQAVPFADRQAASEQAAHDALAGAALPDESLGPRVRAVAVRALVNLYVARDAESGAMLAAITRQPPYYLDWPRDGAFLSLAAELAGRPDWVTQRDQWYTQIIRDSYDPGTAILTPEVTTDPDTGEKLFPRWAWERNYYTSGDNGGTIRFEIDNTALHLWSLAVHAAALDGAERADFVAAVWPTAHDALDLLVRWKEADTGLPALANEDDNPALTSTLHGAVAVYAGLRAGARLAHAAGDDGAGRTYLRRADELAAAIDTYYYDPDNGLYRAARGQPGGPQDSIAGWDTGWLVWPARLLATDDPRLEVQLSADMDGILAILRGETEGGTYTAKNVVAAALYGQDGGARDQARTAVQLLADIATPGTDAFGEVYLPEPDPGGGPPTWSNRTATPHVWEGVLFYLAAMALSEPARFNADESLPLPESGCGCTGSRGGAGPAVLLPLAAMLLAVRPRRRRRR
ncbi:MAG TPA: glycoside hydrolase family 15 protein [Kofleriaceae bacterium]|nr:glycoside hydrolase family 15 protein [Kofleriaceae bacterium]